MIMAMSVFWVIAMMGISFLKWCLASCVRETWTFWPQLVHFVLTDITLPCKSRHHAFRWLTHAIVFSRCIMDTQAWFFHQPFGACFFLANWLKQPGAHGKQLRLCQGLRIPGSWWSICSGFEKKPTFKSRNPWLSVPFTFFPWGNFCWMWPKDAPGKMSFAAPGLCQRQPFVSDANAALRLKALCLEPPRVSLLKTRQPAAPSKAGTQEMTHKERDSTKEGVERNGWNLLGNSGYQQEQHGHTRAKSVYSNYFMWFFFANVDAFCEDNRLPGSRFAVTFLSQFQSWRSPSIAQAQAVWGNQHETNTSRRNAGCQVPLGEKKERRKLPIESFRVDRGQGLKRSLESNRTMSRQKNYGGNRPSPCYVYESWHGGNFEGDQKANVWKNNPGSFPFHQEYIYIYVYICKNIHKYLYIYIYRNPYRNPYRNTDSELFKHVSVVLLCVFNAVVLS